MNYQKIIEEIYSEVKELQGEGKVADYIPALANIDPAKFGIAITSIDGESYKIGDAEEPFSIQSISKAFTLTLAIKKLGKKIWDRVGKEPSGNAFNSLVQLEYEHGIPRNPFINAGALVLTDAIISNYKQPKQTILDFIRDLTANQDIYYDKKVAKSEKEHGFTNAALANFMKNFNNIENDIEAVLDVYFHQCSIAMSCMDLTKAFMYLTNHGLDPHTNEAILTKSQAKRINSLMLTCGLYDESGEFAFKVGLPGKSGVGGGIVAIIPNKLSIAVWGPELDKFGNSLMGMKALELFTTKTEMSIF